MSRVHSRSWITHLLFCMSTHICVGRLSIFQWGRVSFHIFKSLYGKSSHRIHMRISIAHFDEVAKTKDVRLSSSTNNEYLPRPTWLSLFFQSSGISSTKSILIKIKSGNYFSDFICYVVFINYFLNPMKRALFLPIFRPTAMMRMRDTHIAVKRESMIPRPSINPNHLMSDIPNT